MNRLWGSAWIAAAAAMLMVDTAQGQFGASIEEPPIRYASSPVVNAISRLEARIERDGSVLRFDPARGYLASLLTELQVPTSSQMLVFSKTSKQRDRISPRTPRAIYFNDEVYVGWVPDAEVIEISAVDPDVGPVFYTLDQKPEKPTRFARQTDSCLLCHQSAYTHGVPGHLVRSVQTDAAGFPILTASSYFTTYESPLKQRWGGWYVTGTAGAQRHMGNVIVRNKSKAEFDYESGANLTDLGGRFPVDGYLQPSSDIVALMILEHQVPTHNAITATNYETKLALRDDAALKSLDKEPSPQLGPSIQRRIEHSAERVVKALLLSGEFRIEEPIRGTSAFADEFSARGPQDSRGRSLRQLDLTGRLFKHPCSYLIYSAAFDGLGEPVRDVVYRRLWEILSGQDVSKEYSHLGAEDRRAILEILRETKSGLPAYWGAAGG